MRKRGQTAKGRGLCQGHDGGVFCTRDEDALILNCKVRQMQEARTSFYRSNKKLTPLGIMEAKLLRGISLSDGSTTEYGSIDTTSNKYKDEYGNICRYDHR